MFTTIAIGLGLFVSGVAANKYTVNWLHGRPHGALRDLALVVLNGGPGSLPEPK